MSHVVIYDSGIAQMFKNPRGPVAKIINQKADTILRLGKQIAEQKFESRTGDLFASFKKVPLEGPDGYHVAVGNDAQHRGFAYARALETGEDQFGQPIKRGEGKLGGYMVPAVEQAGFTRRA